MKKMKVILAAFLFCALASAENKHEFSIYFGGGLSTLNYNTEIDGEKIGYSKNNKDALGGLGGLGYSLFFTRAFGISTGAEIAMYNFRFLLNDGHTIRYSAIDPEGNNFIFRSTISDYDEKQRSLMLQIPLMLRFQFGADDAHKFYFALGGKGAIPISAKATGSTASLMNGGYYALENYEHTKQTKMGFGAQSANGFEKNIDFNPTGFASAEMGVKFRLRDGLSLNTGVYFDYGLRKIWTKNGSNMVEYDRNNPQDFTMNSVFESFINEITPMAAGLKIGLSFGRASTASAGSATELATEIVAPEPEPIIEEKPVAEPVEAVEAELIIEAVEIREIPTIQDGINFEVMTATLTDNSKRTLEGIYLTMSENPEIVVEIAGHTCITGGHNFNVRLSKDRAQAVVDYLVARGIAPDRLVSVGYGFTKPIADNDTEEGREKNRRVEIRTLN